MRLKCKHCGEQVKAEIQEMPIDSPHYAKALCPSCGRFLYWVKKPKNEGKRTRSSKYTPEKLGIDYCEICGRNQMKLGFRETLEIHHKTPLEENGEDERMNILVLCTPCHKQCGLLSWSQ